MAKIFSTPVISKSYPAGTAEDQFTFTFAGTDANGIPLSKTFTSATPSLTLQDTDLSPGTYVYQVSKNGETSQPSDQFTWTASSGSFTFSVPDATQKAAAPVDA